jgi:hypothetical protein
VSARAEFSSASHFPQPGATFAATPAPPAGVYWVGRALRVPKETTMSTHPSPKQQREALNESEKKAKEQQPGSYKEEETADKVVEIPPSGPDERPIRGLDS